MNKELHGKRVEVQGGYNESAYTAHGYASCEYARDAAGDEEGMLRVDLDSGSHHFYNIECIKVTHENRS